MTHRDDHMDDFFRKHLDHFDESVEEWEKPDPGAWQAAATQVSQFGTSPLLVWLKSLTASLSVLLVAAMVYVLHLRQEVSVLEAAVSLQRVHIEQVEQQLQTLGQQIVSTEPNMDTHEFASQQPASQVSLSYSQEGVRALGLSSTDRSTVLVSSDLMAPSGVMEVPPPSGGIPAAGHASLLPHTHAHISTAAHEDGPAEITSLSPIYPVELDIVGVSLTELLPTDGLGEGGELAHERAVGADISARVARKFRLSLDRLNLGHIQIGYEFRAQTQRLTDQTELVIAGVEQYEWKSAELLTDPLEVSAFHGLTLGLPLTEKWTLQTGLRMSRATMTHEQSTLTLHAMASEDMFTLPDGDLAQQVRVAQTGASFQTSTDAFVKFDREQEREHYLMEWHAAVHQAQTTIQVPVGVTYRLGGKGKWQYVFGLGSQWERITLGKVDTELHTSPYNREQENKLIVSDTELDFEKQSFHSLGAYASLGLQYQLHNNWSLRTEAIYTHYVVTSPGLMTNSDRDMALSLGLRYHF